MKKNTIKIFIDGCKKKAVKRMFPIWKKMGHTLVTNIGEADVQLSSVEIKTKKNIPTVLRLDGIYYDSDINYCNVNENISKSYVVADAVVYQSRMSKIMCEKYLKKTRTNIYSIIYNGVNGNRWCNPKKHGGINIVSCAKWRRWKRLQEIVEVFDEFISYCPGAKLHIIGPILKDTVVIEHKNVIYYNLKQQISFDKIKEIYKTMDICLYLAKKDWCPSSVVETIAAGIPVITTNACGGATEMCKLSKGCAVVVGEDESLDPDRIYKDKYNQIPEEVKIELVKAMLSAIDNKQRAILPKELQIEVVAEKYIDIMRKII